ncbi:uncharacterized protein LACBIDRAFT_330009 [Laccaria bicolor S238N-H82]|uniref:Predicted protein n=1 Tax=Laccaria bicolor (strain S238N-H82 / ATCC MYA-4686) TaxID=486041 RepID=B0DJW7_LACBS|nr:uncharacterized protein LACBIDRAFT_330009 [Laccaria bicolor S238N-H82]EDR05192.1 predicted protein [Laccaria bicolor S238N-H82]|eukprot:XP_001884157.1 predicted protein [Laccaria bicolor S238N-H82]
MSCFPLPSSMAPTTIDHNEHPPSTTLTVMPTTPRHRRGPAQSKYHKEFLGLSCEIYILGLPVTFLSIPVDSCAIPVDSCAIPVDSCAIPVDSCAIPEDSTGIRWNAFIPAGIITKKKDTDSEVKDEIQKGLQDLETATVSRGDAQVKIVRKKARSKKPQVKKVKPDVKEKGKQDVEMAAVGHDVEHAIDVDMEVGLTMGKGKSKGGIDIEMAEVKHEETEVGAIPKADKDMGRVTPTIIIEPPTPHTSAIFKSTETEVGTNTDKGKGQEIGLPASEMEWIMPELAMQPELGLAVNYMQQSFTPPPVERTSRPEGSHSVSRSRQVSPPDPKEVHLDTALYQKKIDFRSLSPPPNFDMQTMQQEIRRLAHGQADLLQKLRDQQVQVSVMESSTPTMREYLAFVVRKQDIDASALLPLAVDSPVTLSQRLLALEEITQCIQDQDLASRPLSEKIASLETSVWFQKEKITGATRQMDRIEESAHMRWKETQEDLQSIRSDHQRLEAEVREAVKTLENKWETTPAALQESLTRGFEKLASRIETAELMLHDLTKSVTTISELNLRLGARQSSLESLIIQFLGNKEKKHTGINTDRSVSPDRGQKSQQVQVSPTPGVVLPNPVSTDHAQVSPTPAVFLPPASESPAVLLLAPNPIPPTRASSPGPYIGGNRKSPRLQKLEPTLQTPAQSSRVRLFEPDPFQHGVNWMGPGWADPRCMGFKALQQTHDT